MHELLHVLMLCEQIAVHGGSFVVCVGPFASETEYHKFHEDREVQAWTVRMQGTENVHWFTHQVVTGTAEEIHSVFYLSPVLTSAIVIPTVENAVVLSWTPKHIQDILFNSWSSMLSQNYGPSGAVHQGKGVGGRTHYSTTPSPSRKMGFTILNELNEQGGYVRLGWDQGAIYLHVDDTLVFTSRSSAVTADAVMECISQHMESLGFLVPERFSSQSIWKAIGYELDQPSGRFMLPIKRQVQLSSALLGLSGCHYVDVDILRCILGVFMFGAQLRRGAMSVPHACYRMVELCPEKVVRMWPSVSQELRAMSRLVPLLFVDCTIAMP